ncbi:HWE histidine kinase domain-containing protein [Loktanella salsilacus]|jgi:two-component sensor histidine kinase|uniref:HWE histidine kinase domain-containing protein n=2 Tax=Loktanella salsilacus TaxID=195913 RepID=UPI0020B86595|nr:HWE histidine kinase domain-containing protein [Loktanella salsilacus]UTH44984.1 PAS domain-containing protein [Loktanella salsilacus]
MSQTEPLAASAAPPSDALPPLGMRVTDLGLGLGTIDYIADTITLDDRAAALFELPANTPVPRKTLHAQIHPDDIGEVECLVEQMLSPQLPNFIDVIHRVQTADGSERWVSARKRVSFGPADANGIMPPVSGIVAIMDMTPHKKAERQVQDLMRETNHRLKNLLTVVQSIARMTARSCDVSEFLPRFNARLRALSHNQDLLVSRGHEGVVLGDLVREQLRPFSGDANAAISISGPDLPLRFAAIQPIGLALHELATNAAKYGALSVPDGTLDIRWDIQDGQFTLSWTESGGPVVVPPQRTGFGSTVLQGMTRSALEAEVTLRYDPAGVHWGVTCDPSIVRDPAAL